MGRQAHYPIALEGALKLKEISYISASGYPSAELKHGVIALITEDAPSLFIAPQDAVFEKNISNIEEVKARKGPVIAIGTEGDTALKKNLRRCDPDTRCPALFVADPQCDSAATPRLPHCGGAWVRCRQTAQSCQERDGRVRLPELIF